MSARRLTTARLELVTATTQHLLVQIESTEKLARLLGAKPAADWPPDEMGEAELRHTLDSLHRHPQAQAWFMRYILTRKGFTEGRTLIGVVGLAGPPQNGSVEIGYSITDGFQGQGLATEAAQAIVDWVFEQDGVERVVAHTRTGPQASKGVLEKLGFAADGPGPEPGTERFVKTRASWLEEGPPSRRQPPLRPRPADEPIGGLPSVAQPVFERLLAQDVRGVDELRLEVQSYLDSIEEAAAENPAVEADIAQDIARVCEGLLDAVTPETPEWTLRQIQAAVRYFVTEDDGDSDLEIGGLDEDAAVANAVATHLGRGDLVSDPLGSD